MSEAYSSDIKALRELLTSLTGAAINLNRETFLVRKCLRALIEEDKSKALEALDDLYNYDEAMNAIEKALKDLVAWVAVGNG